MKPRSLLRLLVSTCAIGFILCLIYFLQLFASKAKTSISLGGRWSHETSQSKSERISPAQPRSPVKSFPRINKNGRVQDRIVIFPHLLLKDSGDVYPFPMQRVTDGNSDNEEDENLLRLQNSNQVAILIDHMYFCGGVVLDPYTVLTAAHCTDGAGSFTIYSGGDIIKDGTSPRVHVATRHEEHPHWSALTLEGDLAMIYLEEEIEVNASIQYSAKKPSTGERVCMLGWGKSCDSFSCNVAPSIEGVCAAVIEAADAEAFHGPMDWEGGFFCVDTSGDRATCNGDSGGPLFNAAGQLVGVCSFGAVFGCGSGAPACFVSISHYLDWISAG